MSGFSKRHIIMAAITFAVVLLVGAIFWVVPLWNETGPQDAFVEVTTTPTEPPTSPNPTQPPVEEDPYQTSRWDDEDEEPTDNRPRSLLTGLPIEEEYLHRRPLAVVINNIHVAQPQSGIAQADVIYEVLAEGDITRFVAIFQSYMPAKIGPVRSTRDYFTDIALNHDSILIHHGGSPLGYTSIRNTGIPSLDGMQLEGTVFWRDRSYPTWHRNSGQRPLEHSSYTSWERITSHMTSRNIRSTVGENPAFGFTFGNVPQGEGVANTISVPFSPIYVRTFIFDADAGLYMVEYQHGPHLDAVTQDQVAVTNVLVQFVTKRVVGPYGRRAVGTVGEGEGFLAVGGYYQPVRWVKESATSPMRWYFEDGTPLVLAPGRTWVNVFQTTGEVTFG